MDNLLVATTRQEGLRPVGTGGQLAIRAYDQIVRYLRRALSDEHAGLLAEPNFSPSRGTIDWYTATDSDIIPLGAATPEQRRVVETRLAALRDDITAKVKALSRSESGGDRHLSEMLRLALEVPDEEFIYCAGDRPVLVCWGTLRDEPDPPRSVLQKYVPYTPPPPTPPPASVPTDDVPPPPDAIQLTGGTAAALADPTYVELQRPLYWLAWLLWLLFGLLVAAILIVLLSGCGVRVPGLGWLNTGALVDYCAIGTADADADRSAELAAELARTQVLEQELQRLELRVAVERRACERQTAEPLAPPVATPDADGPVDAPPATPSPGDSPATPSQPPQSDGAFDERLDREGAQRGEVGITLAWDGDADLDLHVICPGGEEIYFGRRTACGGQLDVDMNVPPRMSDEPVENVFWPDSAAPPGTYRVIVNNYNTRSDGARPTPFRLRVINGGETSVYEGEVHERDGRHTVVEFEVR